MTTYTRIEFRHHDDEAANNRYREAVAWLMDEFEDYLIGFRAEDPNTEKVFCDCYMSPAKSPSILNPHGGGIEVAQDALKTIFPSPSSAESQGLYQPHLPGFEGDSV